MTEFINQNEAIKSEIDPDMNAINLAIEQKILKALEMKEYQKNYYINNRDKMHNLMVEYYKSHKLQMDEKHKEYLQKNKEKLKAYLNKKNNCDICGGCYTFRNKSTHNKSVKHTNAINNLITKNLKSIKV